jgi:hypothetical protein
MRIKELLLESGIKPRRTYHDDVGGKIIITPDPETSVVGTHFSISYINETMARFYNVGPRILGYDTHGHKGLIATEPHLHILQRNKNLGYLRAAHDLTYVQAFELFTDALEAIIKDYTMKNKDNKKITERSYQSEKTLTDFNGSQVRFNNYLQISKLFKDYDTRVSASRGK